MNPITAIAELLKNINYQDFVNNAEMGLDLIKKYAKQGTKETTKIMLELYFVMISETTPKFDRLLIGAALAYNLLPNDLMPRSRFGILGFADNAAALYYVYKKTKDSLTPAIQEKVASKLAEWGMGD